MKKLILLSIMVLLSIGYSNTKSLNESIPEWFLNTPQNYVAAAGSTIEKAFMQVLSYYSGMQNYSKLSSGIIDTTAFSNNQKSIIIYTIGNIDIKTKTERIVEMAGIGVDTEMIDHFTRIIEIVFLDEENTMSAIMTLIDEETGLGADTEVIDNISHSYENCNLNDLIENVKTHGYDIKYEIRDNWYFFLLGETKNK